MSNSFPATAITIISNLLSSRRSKRSKYRLNDEKPTKDQPSRRIMGRLFYQSKYVLWEFLFSLRSKSFHASPSRKLMRMHFIFCFLQLSRSTSIGNTCYAGQFPLAGSRCRLPRQIFPRTRKGDPARRLQSFRGKILFRFNYRESLYKCICFLFTCQGRAFTFRFKQCARQCYNEKVNNILRKKFIPIFCPACFVPKLANN